MLLLPPPPLCCHFEDWMASTHTHTIRQKKKEQKKTNHQGNRRRRRKRRTRRRRTRSSKRRKRFHPTDSLGKKGVLLTAQLIAPGLFPQTCLGGGKKSITNKSGRACSVSCFRYGRTRKFVGTRLYRVTRVTCGNSDSLRKNVPSNNNLSWYPSSAVYILRR